MQKDKIKIIVLIQVLTLLVIVAEFAADWECKYVPILGYSILSITFIFLYKAQKK